VQPRVQGAGCGTEATLVDTIVLLDLAMDNSRWAK
jgi:hypothetical protein